MIGSSVDNDKALAAFLADSVCPRFINEALRCLAARQSAFPAVRVGGDIPYSLLHFPTDPNCDVCSRAKIQRKRAYRRTEEERQQTTAKTFGERIHMDLVGPTEPSIHNERYLLVARDEFSDFPVVAGLKTKEPEEVWSKFSVMFTEGEAKKIRTDNGGEFQGSFATNLAKRGVAHEISLPCRPTTNARAERFHYTLEQGARAIFVMTGLPYVFWSFFICAAWSYIYARCTIRRGDIYSAYSLRHDREYTRTLEPIGRDVF